MIERSHLSIDLFMMQRQFFLKSLSVGEEQILMKQGLLESFAR